MLVDVSVKNCKLVTSSGILSAGIAIEGEKIVAIAKDEKLPNASRVIDAGGNYVLPGIIDPHSHLGHIMPGEKWQVPYSKEVRSETGSAACGGVTTFMGKLMGQGFKFPFEEVVKIVNENAIVDMAWHVGIGNFKHLEEIPEYIKQGVTSFKFHMVEHPKWGLTAADDALIYFGLKKIAPLGYPALPMFHCENLPILKKLREELMSSGRTDLAAWTDSRPNFVEEEAMRRLLYFAKLLNATVYIVHMSIKEGVELVSKKKSEGVKVIAETCPHYLTLTKHEEKGLLAKVNPPLRDREDNEALWRGIKDGIIDCIGSDHVVENVEYRLKLGLWDDHNAGFAGTETLLPVMLSEGVNKGRMSFERLVKVCCENAAKAFGIYPKKGTISIGSDADLVIVDMDKKVKVKNEILHSASDYSVYEGWEFKGWPVMTLLRGNVVAEGGEIVGKPGYGEYLPRRLEKA
jgi:D-hydantoinase